MSIKYQIIIIDDQTIMTELLKLAVSKSLKCEVEVFNDPIKAYERLLKKDFDIISLDHNMPGMKGDELVRKIRDEIGPNSRTPIVMFTGFKEEVKLGPQYLDALLFVDKPIEDDSYLRHIKMALMMKYNILISEGKGQATFFDIVA